MTDLATPTDAIFISIDLESSLGKIDDCGVSEEVCDAMDCDIDSPAIVSPTPTRRITRTRSRFKTQSYENESKKDRTTTKSDQHQLLQNKVSPYPLSETEVEIKEREKLTETVGYNWNIDEEDKRGDVMNTTSDDDVVMPTTPSDGWRNSFNIDVVPGDESNKNQPCSDDFSLSSHEASSLLAEEDSLSMDKISEDPGSFWEEGTMAVSTSATEK